MRQCRPAAQKVNKQFPSVKRDRNAIETRPVTRVHAMEQLESPNVFDIGRVYLLSRS